MLLPKVCDQIEGVIWIFISGYKRKTLYYALQFPESFLTWACTIMVKREVQVSTRYQNLRSVQERRSSSHQSCLVHTKLALSVVDYWQPDLLFLQQRELLTLLSI